MGSGVVSDFGSGIDAEVKVMTTFELSATDEGKIEKFEGNLFMALSRRWNLRMSHSVLGSGCTRRS